MSTARLLPCPALPPPRAACLHSSQAARSKVAADCWARGELPGKQRLSTRELSCRGAAACAALREALPTFFSAAGSCPRHNSWSILSQVPFPGVENRSEPGREWMGLKICLGISPCVLVLLGRTAACSDRSSEASESPQPLHVNNWQRPGVEHCCFCAADNSLKWYCLAKKISQRLTGEQSRFKSSSSGCFWLADFCFPSRCAL